MYDPRVGQFLEEDPIGFDANDENLRRYVRNNPLSASDPTGLAEEGSLDKKAIANFDTADIRAVITDPSLLLVLRELAIMSEDVEHTGYIVRNVQTGKFSIVEIRVPGKPNNKSKSHRQLGDWSNDNIEEGKHPPLAEKKGFTKSCQEGKDPPSMSRTWKRKDKGTGVVTEIEAELVDYKTVKGKSYAILKDTKGQSLDIPTTELGAEGQKYIRDNLKKARENAQLPRAIRYECPIPPVTNPELGPDKTSIIVAGWHTHPYWGMPEPSDKGDRTSGNKTFEIMVTFNHESKMFLHIIDRKGESLRDRNGRPSDLSRELQDKYGDRWEKLPEQYR
jgi:hypothetical protein